MQAIVTTHSLITKRIFDDGLDANDRQIGTYSAGYLETRKRKGLGGSSRVNLQFTQQMKNDFSIIKQGNRIGSGFQNSFNNDKSIWVENTYSKDIFKATKSEAEFLEKVIQKRIDAATR